MKRSLLHIFSGFLMLAQGGCGTVIGNPGVTSEEEETSFVKTVEYDIPNTVSGYSLLQPPPGPGPGGKGNIFTDSSKRIDEVIDRTNAMLKRLNSDRVNGVGDFTAKGPDGEVSGSLKALSGDTLYDYSAVLCYKKQVFQFVKWSSTSGNVYSLRNHAIDPIEARRASDMQAEITYTAGETASIRVLVEVTPPQVVPGADGRKIADLTYSTRSAGSYTLSGVHNWHDDSANAYAEGDEYFIGQFNEDGVGEYLGYNRFEPGCAPSFDEVAPAWCTGQALGSSGKYSESEKAAAATRLSAIGIQPRAELRVPTFDLSALTCPE